MLFLMMYVKELYPPRHQKCSYKNFHYKTNFTRASFPNYDENKIYLWKVKVKS